MRAEDIHAELGDLITGRKAGRRRPDEITLFDSTGIALEDAVTAALVLRRATELELGTRFDFFA